MEELLRVATVSGPNRRTMTMSHHDLAGLTVTAKIKKHPLHPLLVPLPIGFFVATFFCDFALWHGGDPAWLKAGFWALALAIVTTALAAIAGFMDFFGNGRIRALGDAWKHMVGNLLVVVIAVINLAIKWDGDVSTITTWGLTCSTAIFVILLYTGWKGGELAYRHRVGMLPSERD
ncbi:DUF2231 domain-containing protein [Agrobacterium pusense]|uniref:DUF2231 domain-containing protein n=1 Tax=Agrobacterium pusense TaxID=648995 RepID=UPI00244B7A60|nr:DUF2231 domain-containing protein [Agrobacterium pusense]MDH0873292.1 DUF2231 domain-containing protein [Agrobacterium pusense]MDH1269559.1 DUF2231 domain-containing protein [Agrobacterium pusense]